MSPNKTLAWVALVLLLSGCGQTESTNSADVDGERKMAMASSTPEAKPQPRGDSTSKRRASTVPRSLVHGTPEACYAAMIEATKMKDMEWLLSCFAVEFRNQTVGWIAYQVEREVYFQTDKREAALALLKQHGLAETDIMGLMQIYDSPGGKGVEKAVELVGAEVKDQAKLMQDATALLRPDGDKSGSGETIDQEMPVLTDVEIENDRASGTVQLPGSDESAPIQYKKENDSWVIASDPTSSR